VNARAGDAEDWDTTITVDGDMVLKVHRAGTDPQDLAVRLRIATESGCLLTPLSTHPEIITATAGTRWRTRWPRIQPIPQRPEALPWPEAGALLAALHRAPMPAGEDIPAHGAVRSLRRALAGLPAGAPPAIREAAAFLPPRAWRTATPGRPLTVVHGDFHLGQLGRAADEELLLFDVDDLGAGDPAWDLARPAGFWASGLIPDVDWGAFLTAYRRGGGPAVPASGDPWPALEPHACAAVVQAAAAGAAKAALDETQTALVAACARMTSS
jgi:aminoglycoside phosphotransferase (APT) family kinase protein